jgi:hypothetical protein
LGPNYAFGTKILGCLVHVLLAESLPTLGLAQMLREPRIFFLNSLRNEASPGYLQLKTHSDFETSLPVDRTSRTIITQRGLCVPALSRNSTQWPGRSAHAILVALAPPLTTALMAGLRISHRRSP